MAAAENAAPALPVKEGDVLASKYRVEKVLGIGGMGVVVAATHLELDQRVALKFLLSAAATNEELVGRFIREAKASVRLKGTHVAKTLDVGRLDDGCPFMVMEFLEGRDLHAEIRTATAPIPIDTAVSWILQAIEGLAEAHARGIIHRDLKPGNLFLTRGVDGKPLIKVLDFGISKTIDPTGTDGLSLTKTEMLLGSPLYMCPEQMRSSKHVDERSDIWALGAIAYELLVGKVPFEADSIMELCFKVAQEEPLPIEASRAEVPADLARVVMRCLEKDPEKRYGNVGELAADLEPFGTARDKGSAERTSAVLAAGTRAIRSSQRLQAPATPIELPISKLSDAGAVSAWGTTKAQAKEGKSLRTYVIVGAVCVVGAAVGAAMLASSHRDKPVDANLGASSAGPVTGIVSSAHDVPPEPALVSTQIALPSSAVPSASAIASQAVPVALPSPQPQRLSSPRASAKPASSTPKPGASAEPGKPSEPGGFIKVRE